MTRLRLLLLTLLPLLLLLAIRFPASSADDRMTVAGWNVGLDDADVATIAERIAAFDGVDLWGIAEVNRTNAVPSLEKAAEVGEAGDFKAVLGQSGGGMRLVALYDDSRFDLLEWYELDEINTTGNARAPLVLDLRDTVSGERFLFMVNHLYRSRNEERWKQAELLNEWAATKTMPVIAVGDYNFDWNISGSVHDQGYDLMTDGGAWEWVQPANLVTTQCSGWPCQYESVLDFVFVAGPAQQWQAESEIVVAPNDFPDDATTSDHRPVIANFWPGGAVLALPTPTAAQGATPTANSGANLRGGPGTDYPIVGGVPEGQRLEVIGRNSAGDWLQLSDGSWIAAFLVDNAPAGLAVAEEVADPLPTAVPTVAQRTEPVAAPVEQPPTATPVPPPPTATPAPPAPAVSSNCHPSYPGVCIPAPPPDLDCGDIGYRRFTVVGSDPHRFDGDHDGIGCESN